MSFERQISIKNIKRHQIRSAALILLVAFLFLSMAGGAVVVMSLQNGLASYEARLGADIVVVPYEARTKGSFESILLQGIPGYFYMDKSVLDKVREIDGVELASPQFFLASASAGCCSVPVQVIGFDPMTDFSIQPWIQRNYSGQMGEGDVIVGSGISVPTDFRLTFYNVECRVVAQLDETGTGLDNAVYTDMSTIRKMMGNASGLGFNYFKKVRQDRAISSVMVKVKEGYSISQVTDDINIHVRKVVASQSKSMISAISSGLMSVSNVIGILVVMVWVLSLAVLMIAFVMISNERIKEFAVLRAIGASRRMLSRVIMMESVVIGLAGAAAGTVVTCLTVFPFSSLIRAKLQLPYLLPGLWSIFGVFLGSALFSVLAGMLISFFIARRIAGNETGLILRDGA